jgi:translocation and assembly module TamB
VPTLEPARTRLRIEAEDFDLQGLGVFLPEEARGLSGRLDADVAIDPGAERRARGRLQLREGGIYVAALGQEFHDIALDANIEPSGVVKIGRLSARTLSGKLRARGEATLDGLVPRSAHLAAQIPRDDPMPVMLSGVTVADAWGRLELDARLESSPGSGSRLELLVSVPRLHVGLPEQSPHDVQELDDDPTIATGTYLQPNRFLTLPIPVDEEGDAAPTDGAPLLVRIEVRLGNEVWIERGTQLEVKLLGSIDLELKEELSARGELRLGRGTINVQGRTFEVERGVVTFVRERAPSNPTVVATARYTAPDGTEVYADFVGPVETGTLTLRSQPPLRDDQILSVLLFGTQEGNFGASTSKDTAASDAVGGAAIAAGGSLVTRGLNQELRRLTALDIQTRIGESEGQPQPEVVVQLSPRLTAELAYSMGTPNPGRQQDRTYLTLDLRLFRNWSVSTTVGDAGSLLVDLLWRYRY